MKTMEEPRALHENSPRFPTALLERFLGHLYHIEDVTEEAARFGQPARRERKFTRLTHKVKCAKPVPFDKFAERFYRACAMTFREYYWQHLIDGEPKELGAKSFYSCKYCCRTGLGLYIVVIYIYICTYDYIYML